MKGWRIVGASLLLIALALALAFARLGVGDEGLRTAIRVTALASLALFVLAFSAAPLAALVPSRATRWQRANRRFLGIAFALSHIVHGVAIIALAVTGGGEVLPSTTLEVAAGTLGYVFIFMMLATSFERTAAWVGRGAWRTIHTTGGYLILVTFLVTYGGRAAETLAYLPHVLLLLAVLGLRLAHRAMS